MQAKAIVEAMLEVGDRTTVATVEIMLPLVAYETELALRARVDRRARWRRRSSAAPQPGAV